jgi:CRP/FNR family cyclic AMP-dependent transcriptional regulator
MSQGDEADHVLLLTRGRVKIWRDEDEGKRILLAVRWPQDLLGERGVLGGGTRTASVEAIDECVAQQVSVDRFNALIDRFKLGSVLFQYLTAHLQESENLRADRTALVAKEQVARFLVRLMETARCHLGEDAVRINLGIRQADLAAALGLVRQTVALELQALREAGIIGQERGMIIILNPERLIAGI